MIVFEPGPAQVRSGEGLVAGRRIAGRLLPYGSGPFPEARFDPVARRIVPGRPGATVPCGPSDPRAWRDAVARLPPGPVLVGPGSSVERVRGSLLAAAAAAAEAGRAVYLLDPYLDAAPAPDPAKGAAPVALSAWRPGAEHGGFPALPAAAAAGLRASALFPLLPEWTADPDAIRGLAEAAAGAGAGGFVGLVPDLSGESRRTIVDARYQVDREGADRFFEAIHHGDWTAQLDEALRLARTETAARGMAALPPRARGREPDANAAAAARLEEIAELAPSNEHRDSLLHAAVRWIDESVRDLGAIAKEGNFRRIFPWSGAVADAAEAALLGEANE